VELNKLYEIIEEDLVRVEETLNSVSKVDFSWLAEMLGYTLRAGGKRIRPALTLLSGKFYKYNFNPLLLMSASVELLHTATLVHDDAIDNSSVRRGRPTFNTLWGENKAVLLGDYLFAKAGEFAASTQNLRVVKLFAQTLMIISKGELNQAIGAYNLEQDYSNYLYRITAKTASLFSLATESGAVLSEAPEDSIQMLKSYGENLGIAFQIVDDVLDFISTEEELGKPIGSDLSQGTLTLPAMLLLERYPKDNPVRRIFHGEDEGEKQEDIERAISMVCDSAVVDECYKKASEYCDEACRNIETLQDNKARQTLTQLAKFVVKRTN